MFWIIGTLVRLVTFPGILMQTFAMKFACDVLRIDVYGIDYAEGTIAYGGVRTAQRAYLVAVAPFVINTALCAVLTFPFAFSAMRGSGMALEWLSLITGYLGICMGMHAFPDKQKMDELHALAQEPTGGLFRLFYRSTAWIFWLAGILSVVWFDALYTFGVAIALPSLVG